MTKDMNTGRLLYIICLLTISVVGGNLKAQTIVKHQIGFDIRPVRIPTNIISSVVTVLSQVCVMLQLSLNRQKKEAH